MVGKTDPETYGRPSIPSPLGTLHGAGVAWFRLVLLGVGVVPSRAARLVVSPVTLPRSLVMSTQLSRPPL
jgi:hypothetical protein